jgi:hypothetical protein
VTLDGDDYYLGPHGTKASRLEYDRPLACIVWQVAQDAECRRGNARDAASPERAAKIAAAKRGVPRSLATGAKMPKAATGRRHTPEALAKMSAQRKGKDGPPWLNPGWTEAENELLRTLPAKEVARRTGRTVYVQRCRLGINDGRKNNRLLNPTQQRLAKRRARQP